MAIEIIKINGVTRREDEGVFLYNFPRATIQVNTTPPLSVDHTIQIRHNDLPDIFESKKFSEYTDTLDKLTAIDFVDELAVQEFFFDQPTKVCDVPVIPGVGEKTLIEANFTSENNEQAFLVIGQSNAEGRGNSILSPPVPVGKYFDDNEFSLQNWDYTTQFISLNDPVGPAQTGSAWPSFANSYLANTGKSVILNNQALGGTSLIDDLIANWSSSSYLWDESVDVTKRMLHYSQIKELRGIIMSQGESDAVKIGLATATKADYKAALIDLINRAKIDFPTTPFYIVPTNNHPRGAEPQQAWDDVRDAQFEVATELENVFIGFSGTNSFTVANLKLDADETHYTQLGLDEMGEGLGSVVGNEGVNVVPLPDLITTHISFKNRHRGVLDSVQLDTLDYEGRPTSQWDNFINISVKVSAPVTASIIWGDSFNRKMKYDLTVSGTGSTGFNDLKFMYLSAIDTLPENPSDPLSERTPTVKEPTIEFDSPSFVTEIRFNKSEVTDVFIDNASVISLTNATLAAQILTNLPVFSTGLLELNVGAISPLFSNQSYGNKLTFSEINNSLVNTKNTLTKLITGDESTPDVIGITSFINDPILNQTYDFSTFTALEEVYLHLSKIDKLIISSVSNSNLTTVKMWGNNSVRPLVDITEMEIPASLITLDFSSSQNIRSEKVSGAFLFQTGVALLSVDIRDCFFGNSTDMEQTVVNFHAAKSNLPDNGTFNISGQNPILSAGGQLLLDEFTNDKSWTVTYNS